MFNDGQSHIISNILNVNNTMNKFFDDSDHPIKDFSCIRVSCNISHYTVLRIQKVREMYMNVY